MLAAAAACTAAPAVLPHSGPPAQCAFRGTGAEAIPRTSALVLGRFWIRDTDSDEIAWVDPVTLRRKNAYRAALPEQTELWAASPSGRLVAVGLRHEVRIVETETLSSVATVEVDRGPRALAWLSEDLLAGLLDGEAVLWDAAGRRVRSFELAWKERIAAWHPAADRLIALVTPDRRGRYGSARLLVITGTGVDVFELDRIAAGHDPDLGEYGTLLAPGLAFDPIRHRVFVVQPVGPIAEVDLDGRTVSYHSPRTSLLRSIAAALVPSASAKLSSWATVRAVWLGGGLLAVSGDSFDVVTREGEPAGVTIIDTREWSTCLLDRRPTHVAVTAGSLLAWDGDGSDELGGVGLVGYGLADGRRWHLFGRQYLDVQMYGGYAYAINSWDGWRVTTVDVSTGRIVAKRDGRPPTVLPTGSSLQGW